MGVGRTNPVYLPKTLMSPLLIVGSTGTIGRSLLRFFAEKFSDQTHPVWGTTRHKHEANHGAIWLDLAQPESFENLRGHFFRVAIICAAVTSQKACQENYAASYAINVSNTVELAKYLIDSGVFVIFLSSNAVFDGTIPFVEATQCVNPQTAYGQQKAKAEQGILSLNSDRVAVVRLSKVLDEQFSLFHGWIKNLRCGLPIHPFEDLYFAPISAQFAAYLLFNVALRQVGGIIQASAIMDISYSEVAYYLAKNMHLDLDIIKPVSCQNQGVIHVPRHTTLNTDFIQGIGIDPPHPWRVIDELFIDAGILRYGRIP